MADPPNLPRLEEPRANTAPFYLASLLLVAASAGTAMDGLTSPMGRALFVAGVAAAMVFLVLPSWLEHRARVLDRLAVALARLEERQYDLESVRREHRKAQARAEEASDRVAELLERVEEQARSLAELARFREELLGVRQEGQRLQNRLEDWARALMDHLDDQYRLLSHDGVSADYHAGVQRGLGQLVRTLRSLGLEIDYLRTPSGPDQPVLEHWRELEARLLSLGPQPLERQLAQLRASCPTFCRRNEHFMLVRELGLQQKQAEVRMTSLLDLLDRS